MKIINREELEDEKLEKLALEECKLLVNYFSPEEIERLEHNFVDPQTTEECVYGTMTGSCNSQKVYAFTNTLEVVIKQDLSMETFDVDMRAVYYMTPLEEFIYDDSYQDKYWNEDLEVEERMPNTYKILTEIKRLQDENN